MYLIEELYVNEDLPGGWHPYYIYTIVIDNNIVGKLILREGSNQDRYFDGHIGYSIDDMYQGNNYAYKAVLKLIPIARSKGFKELIITCSPNNTASKKTILKLNAKYIETKKVPEKIRKYFEKEEIEKEIYVLSI